MIASLALAAAVVTTPVQAKGPSDLLTPVSEPRVAVALLNCLVKNDGHLTACTVQEESPNDLGVGQAALSMISQTQVDLLGPDGKSRAGSYIQVPVRIRIR